MIIIATGIFKPVVRPAVDIGVGLSRGDSIALKKRPFVHLPAAVLFDPGLDAHGLGMQLGQLIPRLALKVLNHGFLSIIDHKCSAFVFVTARGKHSFFGG